MKRIAFLLSIVAFVMAAVSCAYVPTAPVALVAAGSNSTITVTTVNQLYSALTYAETHPNTTINVSGTLTLPRQAAVRGNGTRLVGIQARILCGFHFTGNGTSGVPIVIMPRLGAAVPLTNQTAGGWFANPAGGAKTISDELWARYDIKALSGLDDTTPYNEQCANEPATAAPRLGDYATFIPELVPAIGCSISNISIGFADPQSDQGLTVYRAQNCRLENISVDRMLSASAKTSVGIIITGSHYVQTVACDVGRFDMNSSTNCEVTNCTIDSLNLEECVRFATIRKNVIGWLRSGDITCDGIKILQNKFKGLHQDIGSMALAGGRRFEVVGNDLDDYAWIGAAFREGNFERNLWSAINDWSGTTSPATASSTFAHNVLRGH
jgi:hypothetical protein